MEAVEFEGRKKAVLEECVVAPEMFQQVEQRLEEFLEPFVASLVRREQVAHVRTFVSGLLSDLTDRNVESIAYRFGQERLPLQHFIGASEWDDRALRDELARQLGVELGEPDGVIVFDPSGFPKSGRESVGVARQWCGRLGKVDNCQVAIFLGYVSSREHGLVDNRLYLPKEWTTDKQRLAKAGVPKGTKYRTRHQLCLEMLAQHGPQLPHAWIAGDDELGRPSWFRRSLRELDERYLLAVPSNTLIRDLAVEPPVGTGIGRPPRRPWQRVTRWAPRPAGPRPRDGGAVLSRCEVATTTSRSDEIRSNCCSIERRSGSSTHHRQSRAAFAHSFDWRPDHAPGCRSLETRGTTRHNGFEHVFEP